MRHVLEVVSEDSVMVDDIIVVIRILALKAVGVVIVVA